MNSKSVKVTETKFPLLKQIQIIKTHKVIFLVYFKDSLLLKVQNFTLK